MFQPEETMREEFYDTEQHRVDLREQVKEADACLVAAQAEFDEAENGNRCGLSCIQQI